MPIRVTPPPARPPVGLQLTAGRRLEYHTYYLLTEGRSRLDSHWRAIEELRHKGFRSAHSKITHHRRGSSSQCLGRQARRAAVRIDGVVAKVGPWTSLLGFTAKARVGPSPTSTPPGRPPPWKPSRFRWAVPEPLCPGRPPAVEVGGVTVSRATLHNEDEIERLGLQIGDEVVVERSGDVIPKVVRVSSQGSYRKAFRLPTQCPICGGKIVREEGEAASRCINANCPARLKESLLHFASRGVMNIDGVGDALVDQLVDRGIVRNVADLYDLKIVDLVSLERVGVKAPAT